MNKGLIFGLGVGLGGAIGAGTTYLVIVRKINREKDQEVEEVRNYYKKKVKKIESEKAKIIDIPEEKEEKETKTTKKKAKKSSGDDEKLSQKVGLAERNTADVGRKQITPSNTDYTKFQKMSEKYAGSAKDLFSYPHEIDEDDFDNDESYKKVILTYYESDDIIADVNDRVSEYTVEDFGYENMNDFGFEGIKYLRNEKSGTDFKIIYEGNLSYDEATGGVNLNDP